MTKNLWMVANSAEYPISEYGPYFTRAEAELAALRLGVRFLLLYRCEIGYEFGSKERCLAAVQIRENANHPRLHTICATCGVAAHHHQQCEAELWADIHEFEHSRHFVRLFVKTSDAGLLEIPNWRQGIP